MVVVGISVVNSYSSKVNGAVEVKVVIVVDVVV
jgi:hypothetical protein